MGRSSIRPSPLLIVLAMACLALASQTSGPLIIFGALAMALGISFLSPLSIRLLTMAGRRAPVAVRLALRDLARYQARSAAALAAISLALGIAVAIMISLAAATYAANAGNLPDNQMQIWIGQPGDNQVVPVRAPAELSALAAAVHRIAGSLGGAAVIPLDMPVNPASQPQPGDQQPVVSLIRAEAAGDVRTLTAIGADSTTRRTLTATTAGTLALLGALLGSGAAYLALAAGHRSDIGALSEVPVLDLAITIVGVPAVAALAGWILAGRRPPVTRQALD